ncbi:OmpP1/FadL family transporter [Thauera sinica]|uniref:OmpP1/FadL family transporter n=1 Tax=Thauera sinica TaxID=2665146 RepID=A0ABW1AQ51_9RHOO|nr:outer membrane protein transport protein [Thauera sp. K11]ATE59617.1 aromatic hydrocarbon degradation protein [Thauera sp. K11]
MSHFQRLVLIVLGALGLAGPASATNVFRLEGYGAVSRAMGGTSAAHDTGSAALLANPATLGLGSGGSRLDLGIDLVTTSHLEIENAATGETARSGHRDVASAYYAPQAGYVRRSGALTWGVGAYAGGGLGTEYGKNSFLSRTPGGIDTGLENSSRLLVLHIPLGMSYQVDDRLTVGGAIEAQWTGMNLGLLLGADQVASLIGRNRARGSLVPALAGIPGLEGAHFSFSRSSDVESGADAWGWGGRLGLTYRLSESTRIGAAYGFRSHMDDLEGKARLTAVSSVAGQIALPGRIRIVDFQMPSTLTVGIAHQATENLLLAADVSHVGWKKVMKDIKVRYAADGGGELAVELPQNYRDVTILSLGAAYRIDRWTLRAGASIANQAIPDNTLFGVIPATPTRHLSAGFSYDFGRSNTLDFAYSHALRESLGNASEPNVSSGAPIRSTHAQDNFVLSYTHRF